MSLECLNELCVLLTKYGMEICEPTQAKALATIAKQIGHRDKGVRSAALNTIVEAYNIVGEEIFILIGEVCVRLKWNRFICNIGSYILCLLVSCSYLK